MRLASRAIDRVPSASPRRTRATRSDIALLTLLVDGHRDDFRRVRDHMRAAGVAADESTLSLELRGLVADGALDDAFASLRAAASLPLT